MVLLHLLLYLSSFFKTKALYRFDLSAILTDSPMLLDSQINAMMNNPARVLSLMDIAVAVILKWPGRNPDDCVSFFDTRLSVGC